MIAFLSLFLHVLVSPFKTQARLEAEISVLRHQLNVLSRHAPSKPKPDGRRSIDLRLALPFVPIRVERTLSGRTGDRRSVASDGLPIVLALEVALLWHPWRAADTRYRSPRSVDGRQVHGEGWARAVADLENLSPQPCGRHRRHGLPDRADNRLQVAIRPGHSQARTTAPATATNSERICPWTRILRSIGLFNGSVGLPRCPSLADFIINIVGYSFW
jgi:hypothetical protein